MQLKTKLLLYPRRTKKLIALVADFLLVVTSLALSLFVCGVQIIEFNLGYIIGLIWIPIFTISIFYLLGIYRSVLRFIDFYVVISLLKAILIAFLFNLLVEFIFRYFLNIFFQNLTDNFFTIEILISGICFSIVLIIGSRVLANFYLSDRVSEKRVVIYGAGSAGIQLASALRVSKEMQPIAFIDSNSSCMELT